MTITNVLLFIKKVLSTRGALNCCILLNNAEKITNAVNKNNNNSNDDNMKGGTPLRTVWREDGLLCLLSAPHSTIAGLAINMMEADEQESMNATKNINIDRRP